ncbi:hypothetical protein ES708_19974 [subsurface metagenome]
MKKSLMNQYIQKIKEGWSSADFETELSRLISEYNRLRGTYLLVYAAAIGKQIPGIQLEQTDYYVIHDLLRSKKKIQKLVEEMGSDSN